MGWTSEEDAIYQWDGNIEGKTFVDDGGGDEGEISGFCKISDQVYTKEQLIGAEITIDGTSYEITEDSFSDEFPYDAVCVSYVGDEENYFILSVPTVTGAGSLMIPRGLWFGINKYNKPNYTFVSKLALPFKEEVVHKIDEKYIPSSGGVTVVEFELDGEGNITANKTVEEVLSATETSVVIGNANLGYRYQPLGICHLSAGESELMPFFGYMRQDGTFMVLIYGYEGEWALYDSPEEGD